MTKRYFEQPELMVVRMHNNDIITESLPKNDYYEVTNSEEIQVAGRRYDSWDAGY